jgi:hypothetical protein
MTLRAHAAGRVRLRAQGEAAVHPPYAQSGMGRCWPIWALAPDRALDGTTAFGAVCSWGVTRRAQAFELPAPRTLCRTFRKAACRRRSKGATDSRISAALHPVAPRTRARSPGGDAARVRGATWRSRRAAGPSRGRRAVAGAAAGEGFATPGGAASEEWPRRRGRNRYRGGWRARASGSSWRSWSSRGGRAPTPQCKTRLQLLRLEPVAPRRTNRALDVHAVRGRQWAAAPQRSR